jgi:hypothetical protein
MSGNAKDKDYSMERRKGSDFGAVFPATFDPKLRSRVVKAIRGARKDIDSPIDMDEIREIAAYISELEETILRHNWGEQNNSTLLDDLKNKTGLDIKSNIKKLNSILESED